MPAINPWMESGELASLGRCVHCGKNAGLLRSRHRECKDRYTRGLDRIVDVTARAVLQSTPAFTEVVNSIARRHFIPPDAQQEMILMGWSVAVDQCLADESMVTHEKELLLTAFAERHLPFADFSHSPGYSRMVLGITIRDVSEGRKPSYNLEVVGPSPLILQDSEMPVWVFEEVELWEERLVEIAPDRAMPPSSPTPLFPVDMSKPFDRIRVRALESLHAAQMGEYMRSIIQPSYEVMPQHLETGQLIVTTQSIYFLGLANARRIPYRTVLAVVPDKELVGVTQEDGTLQLFNNLPGQLASTLILQLAQNGESLKSIEDVGFIGVNAVSQPSLEGVLIEAVTPESPADTAGLAVGDVIKLLGDCPIRSITDLSVFLAQRSPNEVVTFVTVREGEEMTGLLTLGSHRDEGKN